MKPEDFFIKYSPDAEIAMQKTGIPASVTLAQGGIESAYGAAVFMFNFFGIKAGSEWHGDKQLLRTTEVLHAATIEELAAKRNGFKFPEVISITKRPQGDYLWVVRDYFRAYKSAAEGFIDHANFFIVNSRYHQAILDENNSEKFAEDIAIAGYATAPNYGQAIINVIHTYKLLAYDGQAHVMAANAAGVEPHKLAA